LRRQPGGDRPAPAERPVLLRRTAGFDEEVRTDGLAPGPKVLTVAFEELPRGRWLKALFRPPPLALDLVTDDGRAYSYRLVPALAGAGFLLDPLVRDDRDVADLYAGRPLPRVRAFRVRGPPEARDCYRDRLEVRVYGGDGLPGAGPPRD